MKNTFFGMRTQVSPKKIFYILILLNFLTSFTLNSELDTITCPEFFSDEISEKVLSSKFQSSLTKNPDVKIPYDCVEL